VRVRIVTAPTDTIVDGIVLSQFRVGFVYSLPAALATLLIVEGWAEPVIGAEAPTLPPITFDVHRPQERRRRVLTDARLRIELGIAADRRRRN
jgi:hypothetical protein